LEIGLNNGQIKENRRMFLKHPPVFMTLKIEVLRK
jgi:hypothetical protein